MLSLNVLKLAKHKWATTVYKDLYRFCRRLLFFDRAFTTDILKRFKFNFFVQLKPVFPNHAPSSEL